VGAKWKFNKKVISSGFNFAVFWGKTLAQWFLGYHGQNGYIYQTIYKKKQALDAQTPSTVFEDLGHGLSCIS